MRWVVLALMLVSGPAMADEVPVPTENGDTISAPEPSAPNGCHRCEGNPDGGWSDGGYSNPDGAWTTEGGDTAYAPGHSQDWYEGTGPYAGSSCTSHCEWFNPNARHAPRSDEESSGGARHKTGHGSEDGGRGHN